MIITRNTDMIADSSDFCKEGSEPSTLGKAFLKISTRENLQLFLNNSNSYVPVTGLSVQNVILREIL